MVSPYSCIEVTKQIKVYACGDLADNAAYFAVELFFCFLVKAEHGGIHR